MKILKTYKQLFEHGEGEFASYDNSAGEAFWGDFGAGVLPYSKKTGKFLINYRSVEVNEPHTWGVWGGKIDSDENVEETVIREFEEESQYTDNIKLIPAFVFVKPAFTYYNFIGIIDDEFIPILDWESEGYEWITKENLFKHNNKHYGLEALLDDDKTLEIINNL